MKKLRLFKRIGLTATTLFICLAMLITCFTFVAPPSVKAAGEEDLAKPVTSDKVTVVEDVKVKGNYYYGEPIAVPEDATVTAPNGKPADVKEGQVLADQLGVYKVSYTEDGISYDFKVSVTLKEDYFLYIKYNGADIPTYVENNANSKFTLPEAFVKYYNEDNILTEYPTVEGEKDYTIEIEDSLGNSYKAGDQFDPSGKDGKVFITYTARLGKASGTKLLTKTFTVNIQSKVNKSGNPTLAVSGITRDASVNRPVTLPVATVSDNNDDNVKVVIEVLYEDKPVNNVKVNEDGYAYEVIENDPVEFDNDKSMTFYPTKVGKYKVRYTAYNDFYDENNPSAGGKSSTSEATIEVADHVAPVFKNTAAYEYLIPETWGINVTRKNDDGEDVDVDSTIKFLIPEVVDNKCHMPVDENDTEDVISIYFRITDADNSKTVLSITNILASGSDGKFTANSTYTEDASFENGEFVFDFTKYKKVDSKNEEATLPGTYTVLYRARDKDNNTSSKTYTITLKEDYNDDTAPSAAEVTAPDYLSAEDETFTVPYPVYADSEDSRPHVIYRIYTDAEGADPAYLDVKGGEEASFTKNPGYLVLNDDTTKSLKLGDNLYFYVAVTDKVGNFRSNAADGDKFVTEENILANLEKIDTDSVTKLIKESDDETKFTFNGEKIKFVKASTTDDNGDKVKYDENTPIIAGNYVNAGSFTITAANEDMRNYTGFEVAVYDPEGTYVDVTLETLSDVKSDVTTIYVKDIRFLATLDTEKAADAEDDEEDPAYTMVIRVFDVNGNNSVYGYKLTGVNKSPTGSGQTSAISNIDNKGNINVKYKLRNTVIKHIVGNGTYRVVRKISGGIFSVMGNELVAKTAGSYSLQDGYIDANDIIKEDKLFDYDTDVKFSDANQGAYSFTATDDSKPVIELQGKMPTYSEKDTTVTIPTAVAYTEHGMGTVKIEVKDPDGKAVKLNEADNTFKVDKDGVYTVTYTGVYENGEKAENFYKISVGDVFAPKFTLTGGTSTNSAKKEGDSFSFKTIELVTAEEGVQIRKEIYDPSHELISGSTVDGSYSGYAGKANNGSEIKLNKVGEYTIVYTAKDAVGNDYKITETLTVTSKGSSTPTTWTTLSTVLIIVAILLLAGVIIYVVRFRKVKK